MLPADRDQFEYAINGVTAATDPDVGETAGFGNVMIQIHNFGSSQDTPGAINNVDAYTYSTYWASSTADLAEDVPEPATAGRC
jgi:hypothetical protein